MSLSLFRRSGPINRFGVVARVTNTNNSNFQDARTSGNQTLDSMISAGGGGIFHQTRVLLEKSKKYKHLNPITPDNATNPLSKSLSLDKSALHVVSSPLGNIKDFTIRALEVLRQCDYIVCTNRNATKALLNIIDIDYAGRLIQLGGMASTAVTATSKTLDGSDDGGTYTSVETGVGVSMQRIVDMLKGGRSVALLTPAGTPCIADHGTDLVKQCILNGVRVVSVPGASAVTASLSISGASVGATAMLATSMSGSSSALSVGATAFAEGAFFFGGYLSEKPGPRARQIRQIRDFSCPVVFFEVPKRLVASLTDMAAILDRKVGDTTRNFMIEDEMLVEEEEASAEDGVNSMVSAESVNRIRNRNHRKPRRVTVLHEITKFNESSHSGSTAALLRFYSQMGRSNKLTELGQLTIVIDGVSVADLAAEEAQQAARKEKAEQKLKETKEAAGIPTQKKEFFKSSIFGGNNNAGNGSGAPTSVGGVASSSLPSSPFSGASSEEDAKAQRKAQRELKRKRLRARLIARIQKKQAQLSAKAMVAKEAARREHEELASEPRPLY